MEPPEMVPPVKRTLGWVRWGGEGMWGVTHRTLGCVVLPPSQVRPRRSLAVVVVVVVLSGVGVGAALLHASNRVDARKDRSMFGLCDFDQYKHQRRDCMLKRPFYTSKTSHSCISPPALDLARRHPAACSMPA